MNLRHLIRLFRLPSFLVRRAAAPDASAEKPTIPPASLLALPCAPRRAALPMRDAAVEKPDPGPAMVAIATSWTRKRGGSTVVWTIQWPGKKWAKPRTLSSELTDPATRAGLVLDAVSAALKRADARGVRVSIGLDDARILDELRRRSSSFPQARFHQLPEEPTGRAGRYAVATLLSATDLLVATDASIALRNGLGAGISCVPSTGEPVTAYCRAYTRPQQIDFAELEAIHLAMTTYPGALHILSDSAIAVALATGTGHQIGGTLGDILDRISRARGDRPITIEWIKAHDGHPLNEAADGEAVAARRIGDRQGRNLTIVSDAA